MPLTLTLTEGVLPGGTEKEAVARLTDAMLKWHELSGNEVMIPNITAQVHILPKAATYSGGKTFSGAWVEWKTPSFAFHSREMQKGYFKEAIDIIHELSGGKQPRDNIYVNVVHAVDGAWSINGVAMTNEEIGKAIANG